MAEVYREKTIAFRCTLCGKLEVNTLSVFSFSGTRSCRIHCSCGFRKAVIHMKDCRFVHIQVPCILCEAEHNFAFAAKKFWGAAQEGLFCPESGAELGIFGDGDAVKEAAICWDSRHTGGFDDYFRNPPVMFEMLNHLHTVAENRRLLCHCGSQDIEVDLYPDSLELRCSSCGEICLIPAVADQDQKELAAMDAVIMQHGEISCEREPDAPTLYRLK